MCDKQLSMAGNITVEIKTHVNPSLRRNLIWLENFILSNQRRRQFPFCDDFCCWRQKKLVFLLNQTFPINAQDWERVSWVVLNPLSYIFLTIWAKPDFVVRRQIVASTKSLSAILKKTQKISFHFIFSSSSKDWN